MPTVTPYKDDSGYYVTANPGSGNPIRIKTRNVMDDIFRELGISEKTKISHNLCWALYDAGLIYTKNSISDKEDSGEGNLNYDLSAVDLTEEQRHKLLEAVEKNTNSEKVAELRDMMIDHPEFTEATSSTNSESKHDTSESADKSLREIAKVADENNEEDTTYLDEPVSQTLDSWNVAAILNSDGEEVERSDLSRIEARGLNNSVPESDFPDITPVYVRSTEDFVEYGIPYETESIVDGLKGIEVYDYRGTEDGASATLDRRYKARLQVFYDQEVTLTMVFGQDHGCIEKSISPPVQELTSGLVWPDAMQVLDDIQATQEKMQKIEEEFRSE